MAVFERRGRAAGSSPSATPHARAGEDSARKLPRAVLRPRFRGRDRAARSRARRRPQPRRLRHLRRSVSARVHRLAGLQLLRRPFRHRRRRVPRGDVPGDARDRGARDSDPRRLARREHGLRRRLRDPAVTLGRALPSLVRPRPRGATVDRPLCVAVLNRDRDLAGVPRARLPLPLRPLGSCPRLGAEHPAAGAQGVGGDTAFRESRSPSAWRCSRSSSWARRSS